MTECCFGFINSVLGKRTKRDKNNNHFIENRPYDSPLWAFPGGASGKEPACQHKRCQRHGSVPRLERSPGGGHGNPLQYSCLENPMDRGTWQAIVHRVAKSQTGLKHLSTSTSSPISKKAEPRVQSILDSERFPLLASRPKQ